MLPNSQVVVARELDLPTIVGVSGGLMKTDLRIHVNAGKGKVSYHHQRGGEGGE
jgi:phosphohistidine swiveling domain-containing protein